MSFEYLVKIIFFKIEVGEAMNKYINRICTLVLPIMLFLVLFYWGVLYHVDMFIADRLYRQLETPDRNIIIITIDEKAEHAYGKFSSWNREKLADLVEYLYSDPECAPAVLGFDIMFIGDEETSVDQRLADVCGSVGNIVCASNLKYDGVPKTDNNGKLYFDNNHISQIELPYNALNNVVSTGFANACLSEDNIIRRAQLYITHEGEQMYGVEINANIIRDNMNLYSGDYSYPYQ